MYHSKSKVKMHRGVLCHISKKINNTFFCIFLASFIMYKFSIVSFVILLFQIIKKTKKHIVILNELLI